jgi:hypothetical protein
VAQFATRYATLAFALPVVRVFLFGVFDEIREIQEDVILPLMDDDMCSVMNGTCESATS